MTRGSHYLCICIGAILTSIGLKTLYCTRGSICYNALIVMTESGNFSLLFKCYITYGALLTVGKTCLKTGCSLACYCFLGMAESCGFVTCTCFTTSCTCIGCVTAVQAIGKGYRCTFLMTESYGFVTCIGLVTTGTCICCITTIQAIGSSYHCIIGMSCYSKLVVGCVITS